MREKINWLGIGLLIVFVACAPRVVYMPVAEQPQPTKSAKTDLPVYTPTNPPPQPYRVIGILIVDEEVDLFNFTRLTDNKIIQKLKEEAREHGADAIFVGELKSRMNIIPESMKSASAQVRLTKHAGAYAIVWEHSNRN